MATIKNMKKRDIAWRTYGLFPPGKNCQEYKKVRNEINSMVKQMKRCIEIVYSEALQLG